MRGFRKSTTKEKKMIEEMFKEVLKNNPDMTEEEREKMVKELMGRIQY